jgi:hypothetical protein
MATEPLTKAEFDRIFRNREEVGSQRFIERIIKSRGVTFEAARDVLYRALEDRVVALTPAFRVRPAHPGGEG